MTEKEGSPMLTKAESINRCKRVTSIPNSAKTSTVAWTRSTARNKMRSTPTCERGAKTPRSSKLYQMIVHRSPSSSTTITIKNLDSHHQPLGSASRTNCYDPALIGMQASRLTLVRVSIRSIPCTPMANGTTQVLRAPNPGTTCNH